MFQRKAYDKLRAWKQRSQGRTALLLEGAQRVGKSTLATEFAKREYKAHIVIDFSEAPEEVKGFFRDYHSDVDTFFMYLTAYYGVELPRRESLVVFDEVQRFPAAREFIKQLVADGRYDYLETGSLISIRKNVEDILIPSEEEPLRLDPMNFGEFMAAAGEGQLAELIARSFKTLEPLPETLHRKAERLFREYMLVGGMPQAVAAFLSERNFAAVDRTKRTILTLYRNDIERFGGGDTTRIGRVLSTIPGQLAKHDRAFRLAGISKNARMREYADAFFWLDSAHITSTCHDANDPSVGLAASLGDTTFKSYMADTGLLVTQQFWDSDTTPSEVYRDILLGKLQINEGMIVENAVAQQLRASGSRLFFYSRRDDKHRENTMEIDFLVTRGYDDAAGRMRVSPVEVKSSKRYGVRSLEKFKEKFGSRVGTRYVLHPKPMRVDGDLVRLPLYMAHLL